MRRVHKFTPKEKLELDAIISMVGDAAKLYELSVNTLDRALQEAERGHLRECTDLRVQSLNAELRALEVKIKLLDRYQQFLEGIARAEGWTIRKEARNAGTG